MLPWDEVVLLFGVSLAFLARYLRTVVSIFTYLLFKPYPIAENPRYTPKDVTVIVPTTFKTPVDLLQCLQSIDKCSPAHIFVVTADANVRVVKELRALNSIRNVTVLGVAKLNKRNQMLMALGEVQTEITVFADDDVFWPDNFLNHLLAIFEHPIVGAGGARQRVRRNAKPNVWNFLGIGYLERRVWNNITTNAIDGSISTLSGRTAAYRTEILKNEEFSYYFVNDKWLGKPLNTDDDKCLTRYVYSHGWKIAIQTSTVIETTLEDNWGYVDQCMRWARGHWRGNLTVMTNESYWRSMRYAWGCYVIYAGQFQTPALLVDSFLFYLLHSALLNASASVRTYSFVAYGLWIFFTKNLKMIPHYIRHPADMRFIPVSIAFSYIHGFFNIYALCTLTTIIWGSQKLEQLEKPKAETDEEVIPLLRDTMAEMPNSEPEVGRAMIGQDYVSLIPLATDTSH